MASGPGSSMQKLSAFRNCCSVMPFLLIDDDAMHEGDLRRRPAEGENADLCPSGERVNEAGPIAQAGFLCARRPRHLT